MLGPRIVNILKDSEGGSLNRDWTRRLTKWGLIPLKEDPANEIDLILGEGFDLEGDV